MTLKQTITDQEKYQRIRQAIEQRLQSKSFENYAELALLIDTSKNSLYQVMSGSRIPPDILIYKFCEYFGYQPAYFFGREPYLTSIRKPSKSVKSDDLLTIQKLHSELGNAISAAINK